MNIIKTLLLVILFIPVKSLYAHQDAEISGFVAVDGGRIWYRLNGAQHLGKKPALLVMHGGPGGTHRGNMPYVDLSDKYPVILYDQLGTGNSDRHGDVKKWTVDHFVGEIDQIRAALKLKDIIIIGHSWGGTLAAEYARRNPKGLKGTIMSSPLISTAQWISDNQDWIEKLPPEVRDTLKKHIAARSQDHPDYKKAEKIFYSRHMCRQDPCPNLHYKRDGPPWNPDMYKHMWGTSDFYATGTLINYDISQDLHTITSPTLMICGEYDEAAPESCKKFAGNIKGAKTVIIPNAGHATMAENEALYLKTVREFLSTIPEIQKEGPRFMSNHHKINYVEFPASDIKATKAFFNKAFGWDFQDYGPEYSSFSGEGTDGGFYKSDLKADRSKGSALVVLYSENLEKTLEHVKEAGGEIIVEIFSFPGGRRFHFTEPSGNEFAVWSE